MALRHGSSHASHLVWAARLKLDEKAWVVDPTQGQNPTHPPQHRAKENSFKAKPTAPIDISASGGGDDRGVPQLAIEVQPGAHHTAEKKGGGFLAGESC